MDRSNVIKLIKETSTQDSIGQYVPVEISKQVYCDVRSVTRTEWLEGGRNGMQPAYVFYMVAPDYEGEKIIEYDGKRYGIYRTYHARNDTIELYAEEKAGLGGIATTSSTASTSGEQVTT